MDKYLKLFNIRKPLKTLEQGYFSYDDPRYDASYVLYKEPSSGASDQKYILGIRGGLVPFDSLTYYLKLDISVRPLSWIVPVENIHIFGSDTVPYVELSEPSGKGNLSNLTVWPDDLNGQSLVLLYVDTLLDEASYHTF